ncbi:hypothetical protein DS421_3g69280 [Arachis hypogaea]|nr:hypothetical protein DS421_3g69280 [Arachis hypogaea]
MSLWSLAVIGALNFYLPSLVIIALVLSLAWTSKIMRNVVNISVSRVVALYYLRGMQSSTKFGFLRALTRNLGSACLGSLFVPAIEATKVVARFLNLVEGEDEFLFCCARCCFRVMESIFRYGNGWAYVQIAAYGKGFVAASQDTWSLFKRLEMEPIVDSDITSSICFLSGVSIASICVIAVSPWISQLYQNFTATLSLLTFFIGYLLTRIAMALPQACDLLQLPSSFLFLPLVFLFFFVFFFLLLLFFLLLNLCHLSILVAAPWWVVETPQLKTRFALLQAVTWPGHKVGTEVRGCRNGVGMVIVQFCNSLE